MKSNICVICGSELQHNGNDPTGFVMDINPYMSFYGDDIIGIRCTTGYDTTAHRIVLCDNSLVYVVDWDESCRCCDRCNEAVIASRKFLSDAVFNPYK